MLATSLLETLLFFLTLAWGVFLPGLIVTSILRLKIRLSLLETFLYSFAFGLGILDVLYLLLNRLAIPLSKATIITCYVLLFVVLGALLIWLLTKRQQRLLPLEKILFSKRGFLLALLLFAFSLFIKVWFLSDTVLPTATDLGHHVYWAKLIADEERLPVYEKQEVLQNPDGSYMLSAPAPIADFIIGEHMPLAFLQKMTGVPFTTALPVVFLYCVNLASLFTLTILAWRIFESFRPWDETNFAGESIFLLALFVFGPLFTLASPETKFVSGGVVGNIIGNFFVPLILLSLIRALALKNSSLLTAALALIATLAYTHHLSTFIFLFIAASFVLVSFVFLNRKFFQHFTSWMKVLFKPTPLIFLAFLVGFILFIGLPSYLAQNAVTTAVGTPSKSSRAGLTLQQVTDPNGIVRTGAALFGMMLILLSARLRKNYAGILLFAWAAILLVATLKPGWLFINIPSNRVSYYVSFPIGLLTVFSFVWIIDHFKRQTPNLSLAHRSFTWLLGLLFFTTLVVQGTADNASSLSEGNRGSAVAQTFAAAQYLAAHTSAQDQILKDHNFIDASDTWMKIFFNRGFAYPLSRSNFSRYDVEGREQCTLAMISTPNTALGQQCYTELGVNYLIVNPRYDYAQFAKSDNFALIYSSPQITIFHRLK